MVAFPPRTRRVGHGRRGVPQTVEEPINEDAGEDDGAVAAVESREISGSVRRPKAVLFRGDGGRYSLTSGGAEQGKPLAGGLRLCCDSGALSRRRRSVKRGVGNPVAFHCNGFLLASWRGAEPERSGDNGFRP